MIIFIGGGTIEYMPYASKYTTGSNAISFNDGELRGTVNFVKAQLASTNYYMLFRSTTAGDVFTYFLAPTGICNGAGIKSGTFYFYVNDTSAMGTLDTSRTSGYTTTNLNAFNFSVNNIQQRWDKVHSKIWCNWQFQTFLVYDIL